MQASDAEFVLGMTAQQVMDHFDRDYSGQVKMYVYGLNCRDSMPIKYFGCGKRCAKLGLSCRGVRTVGLHRDGCTPGVGGF